MRERIYCDHCHLTFGRAEKLKKIDGFKVHASCEGAFVRSLATRAITVGMGVVRT